MNIEIHHGLWKCFNSPLCEASNMRIWIRDVSDEAMQGMRVQCGKCFGNMTNIYKDSETFNV